MPRTPIVTRDRVPESLRAAFDVETASSGGVVASGPGSVMINSPEMRRRANQLVNYLRDESTLPKKIQELAMLVTARAMDCQFIWNAHAARGRREGLSDALVDALRDRRPLPSLPADEAAVKALPHSSPGHTALISAKTSLPKAIGCRTVRRPARLHNSEPAVRQAPQPTYFHQCFSRGNFRCR